MIITFSLFPYLFIQYLERSNIMYQSRWRSFSPGLGRGFGGGGFFLPFTLGALSGAFLTPSYRPFPYYYPYYYPYFF